MSYCQAFTRSKTLLRPENKHDAGEENWQLHSWYPNRLPYCCPPTHARAACSCQTPFKSDCHKRTIWSPPVDANVIPLMSHSNCQTYIEASKDGIIMLNSRKSNNSIRKWKQSERKDKVSKWQRRGLIHNGRNIWCTFKKLYFSTKWVFWGT